MRMFGPAIVCALLAGACGDDSSEGPFSDASVDSGPDAYVGPVFDCWPSISPVERGSVTLGASDGAVAYRDMPETLPLEWGSQGGYMVKVWTRMSGFLPGKTPYTAPENPFTRVRATFADTGLSLQLPTECAFRSWYLPNDVGGYDTREELAVIFQNCWRPDRLVGTRIKLDVELMDATGSYATDSRVITATEASDGDNDPTPATCGT